MVAAMPQGGQSSPGGRVASGGGGVHSFDSLGDLAVQFGGMSVGALGPIVGGAQGVGCSGNQDWGIQVTEIHLLSTLSPYPLFSSLIDQAIRCDPGPSNFDGLDAVPFSPRSPEGVEYKRGALPSLSVPDSIVGYVTHSNLIIPKDLPAEGQKSHSQSLHGEGQKVIKLSQKGQGLEYPKPPLLEILGNPDIPVMLAWALSFTLSDERWVWDTGGDSRLF